MTWKEFLKDYLSFTRKERIAVICLVGLIMLIFFIPEFISAGKGTPPVLIDSSWMQTLEKNGNKNALDYPDDEQDLPPLARQKQAEYETQESFELFYFDPNTLTHQGWSKLGIREKTISTIRNYLGRGGKFRQPEDLKKIYGLKEEEYNRIKPYIRIENTLNEVLFEKQQEQAKPEFILPKTRIIDINLADTAAFIALPGIGNKLASRIVNFREKLGGFYSVEQVREIYGLTDSTFTLIRNFLKIDNPSTRKIDINSASLEELRNHPYIKTQLANLVIAYRDEHGPFKKASDLRNIPPVTDDLFQKLSYYIEVK